MRRVVPRRVPGGSELWGCIGFWGGLHGALAACLCLHACCLCYCWSCPKFSSSSNPESPGLHPSAGARACVCSQDAYHNQPSPPPPTTKSEGPRKLREAIWAGSRRSWSRSSWHPRKLCSSSPCPDLRSTLSRLQESSCMAYPPAHVQSTRKHLLKGKVSPNTTVRFQVSDILATGENPFGQCSG